MKVRSFIFFLSSTLLFACQKYEEAPREACPIPYVDFVANVNTNTLEVSFVPEVVANGTISSHRWDFGDGTSFNGPNPPPHKYPSPGSSTPASYRIKYTVVNECGEAFWTRNITVSPCLPNVGFTYSVVNDSTVQFTNTTTSATPVTYTWDFGDGSTNTSSTNSFSKSFAADGSFTVKLKATNACGDNFYSQVIRICRRAVPSQTVNVVGCGTVTLDASASKYGARYQWNFGNGVTVPASPGTSPTVSYTYPSSGTYNITLTVINQGGCDTATITTPVTVNVVHVVPNNNWAYTSDDLDFKFTRQAAINATSYTWNFGDGTSANEQNIVSKVYNQPGTYTLTLTASNGCNSHSFTGTINVPYYKPISNAPNTGLREVVVLSPTQIYFLGTNGKLYRTDTSGNWSSPISLPEKLDFNSNTQLHRDSWNNLWIFGKNEMAKFNPANNTWTSFWSHLRLSSGTTIESMAVDNYETFFTIANNQVRMDHSVLSSNINADFSSVIYAINNNLVWVIADDKPTIYYATGVGLVPLSVQGLSGAKEIKANPVTGDLIITTSTGLTRLNNYATYMGTYHSGNTNGLLTGPPSSFSFDTHNNVWAIRDGKLLKIPLHNPQATRSYSFNSDLNNVSSVDVMVGVGNDNDLILSKTSGNVAIKVR